MNRPGLRSALGVALLLATAASAQDLPGGPLPMVKIFDARLWNQIVPKSLSADVCYVDKLGPRESCEIKMTLVEDDQGNPYCVAAVPEVKVNTDSTPHLNNKRRIRWELTPNTLKYGPNDRAVRFHPDYGIVILKDDKRQLDRLGEPGFGAGSGQGHFFRSWTRRDILGAETTYLPVIIWGEGEDARVCAAVDPKIVNVKPDQP